MKKVVYFTRFLPSIERGGGSRRMLQIEEIFSAAGWKFEVVSSARQDYIEPERWQKINRDSSQIMDWEGDTPRGYEEYKMWSPQRRDGAFRLGEIAKEWAQVIFNLNRLSLAMIDDPIYFSTLFETLKQHHIPVVSICHNIESLAPTQVQNCAEPGRPLFNKELDLAVRCDMVITISREETVLFNNLGVETVFLPYYPIRVIDERLQAIREKREKARVRQQTPARKSNGNGILLLGNALNLETRKGMEKVIASWAGQGLHRVYGKLLAVGLKTEAHLQNVCRQNPEAVELLGTLPAKELDELLTTVKACLCYQEAGGGALTRIVEMLIAGVPVLANSHACRTYYNTGGLIEFRDLQELDKALAAIDTLHNPLPIPLAPDTAYLLSRTREKMKKNT